MQSSSVRLEIRRLHELHRHGGDARATPLESSAEQRRPNRKLHRGEERRRRNLDQSYPRHAPAAEARVCAPHAETLQAWSPLPRQGLCQIVNMMHN